MTRVPHLFDYSVDGVRVDVPNWRQIAALVALFLLVSGQSFVQVLIKTSQVTTPPEMYETTTWIDERSEANRSGDRLTYVFSP